VLTTFITVHELQTTEIKYIIVWFKEDRQCTYNAMLGRVRVTIVAVEKKSNKHCIYLMCVCILVLVISHENSMFRASYQLPSVACQALKSFSTLFHKRHDFREKLLNIKCVLIFSTNLSETSLTLRRLLRDFIINVYWSSCKVPVIFVRF